MSLYAEYLRERTEDLIIEDEVGFATYRYLNDLKSVYIIDIFTRTDFRKEHHASYFADQIVAEAKKVGCTELLGTVVPSAHGSTISMKVLIAYGMELHKASDNLIVFRKDI